MSRPPHRTRASSGSDAAPVVELVDLTSGALRSQVRQLRKALEELGAGRYGLGAAARDLGESTGRALTLSADLMGLFSRSLFLPKNHRAAVSSDPRDRKRRPAPPPEDHEPRSAAPPEPAPPPDSSPTPPPPPRKMGARQMAELFLTENLGTAEKHSKEILRLAKAEGISESTLQRAKRRLGVRSRREGFGPESRVFWQLPPKA